MGSVAGEGEAQLLPWALCVISPWGWAGGGRGHKTDDLKRGLRPSCTNPWASPDHREELGTALNALKNADTHWAEKAGGSADAHVQCKAQKKQPEPAFLMGSLILVHPGHRPVLKTLYNLKVQANVLGMWGCQPWPSPTGTHPTTSRKGLGEQGSAPNTATHMLAA